MLDLIKMTTKRLGEGHKLTALVKKPGIGLKLKYFSAQEMKAGEVLPLCLSDKEKKRIIAPVCVPNLTIYRDGDTLNNDTGNDALIYWTAPQIEKDQLKYAEEGRWNMFNLEHEGAELKGLTLLETWIIEDETYDKAWKHFDNGTIPIGTLMNVIDLSKNLEIWDLVKCGEIQGLSVQGYWGEDIKSNVAASAQEETNSIFLLKDILEEIIKNINEVKK